MYPSTSKEIKENIDGFLDEMIIRSIKEIPSKHNGTKRNSDRPSLNRHISMEINIDDIMSTYKENARDSDYISTSIKNFVSHVYDAVETMWTENIPSSFKIKRKYCYPAVSYVYIAGEIEDPTANMLIVKFNVAEEYDNKPEDNNHDFGCKVLVR